jgi:PAS domain S-box-containing protein
MPDSTSVEKETQLRYLADANIVGVMIADTDRVIDANDHYLRVTGYTRTDVDDGLVRWRDMTPPEWLTATETAAAELTERGACTPYEKELLRKNGTRVPVLTSSTILEQEPLTFNSFVLDLTKMKHLEAALHRAEAEAERSKIAASSFTSRISHDLRSPLNVVLGFGQLLQLDDLDTNQRASVDQILNAANQLLALINETLDLSRSESKHDSS